MDTNHVPPLHMDDNPTNCCPRFHPEDWQDVDLHFRDKRFVRAEVRSAMHVPLNMGKVFGRVNRHVVDAGAHDPKEFIVLSRDTSPWKSEHLFAAGADVPEEQMTTLSGDFFTHVFEGPFGDMSGWYHTMKTLAAERGKPDADIWFYYSTCPKCAKAYGKNYVVGLASM